MPIGFPTTPTLNQEWPVVSPIWRFNGTKWEAITSTGYTGATPITERLTALSSTDDSIWLRDNIPYLVAASVVEAGPVASTAPSAFTVGQWTAEQTVLAGQIGFNISALPANGGSAITSLEYRVGTGAAIAFTGTGTGLRVVTAGLTAGVTVDLQVRAVNAIGAGAWSDTKTRTPLAAGAGGDLTFVKGITRTGDFGNDMSLTFGSNVAIGSHVLAAFMTSQTVTASGTGATVDSITNPGTTIRGHGIRTPSLAAAAAIIPYALSSGDNFGGFGIEVTGSAPVFDSVVSQAETVGAGGMRTLTITVAVDNSMVLLIGSGDNSRSYTYSAGLNSLNVGDSYQPCAWGKFNAGTHVLEYTPTGPLTIYGAAAFVWSPGP